MPRRPDPNDDNYPVSFEEVVNSPVYPWRHLSWLYQSYVKGDPDCEFIKENFLLNLKSEFVVLNAFEALEGEEFRQSVQTLGFKRVWSAGPLAPTTGASDRGGIALMSTGEVMTWLDGCPKGSVVYVCFGSQLELSGQQVQGLAAALELSGVRFLWVIKGTTEVPDGFKERTADKGYFLVLNFDIIKYQNRKTSSRSWGINVDMVHEFNIIIKFLPSNCYLNI